jgi:hypothetical protein
MFRTVFSSAVVLLSLFHPLHPLKLRHTAASVVACVEVVVAVVDP